jgi:D-alanyl-D-alanine carboxypeptidase (penicillin-binding protein 5/6)
MMYRFYTALLVVVFTFTTPVFAASSIETSAQHAILMDADTGTILFDKASDERMYPASTTKIMTAYLVFEKLRSGEITLEQEFITSQNAWKTEGSRTFLEANKPVSVSNLIQGMIVQSGNDASVALAEAIAGSVTSFADMMTARAQELGMKNSFFRNPDGLPDPEHMTTVHDLAILAQHLINDFPEYYHYFGQREFEYNKINQHARNPLLRTTAGADGLKTGYTADAGYTLVGSVKRGDQRLILVVAGCKSPSEREKEAVKLVEWGFREFRTYKLFKKGQTVADANVWLGTQQHVPLVTDQDIVATLPVLRRVTDFTAKVTYTGPLHAPVKAGTPVGELTIGHPMLLKPFSVKLKVGEDVEKITLTQQAQKKFRYMFFGDLY